MKKIPLLTVTMGLIISIAVSILVLGVNSICTNMNNAYLNRVKSEEYSEGSIEVLAQRQETYIPYFLMLQHPEPYRYELSVMGSSIIIDIKKYAEAGNMLKSAVYDLVESIKTYSFKFIPSI